MSPHRRITDPVEAMAQRVAERVVDLVLNAVDLSGVPGSGSSPARPNRPASPLAGDAGSAAER
jgi:hypothetical protein